MRNTAHIFLITNLVFFCKSFGRNLFKGEKRKEKDLQPIDVLGERKLQFSFYLWTLLGFCLILSVFSPVLAPWILWSGDKRLWASPFGFAFFFQRDQDFKDAFLSKVLVTFIRLWRSKNQRVKLQLIPLLSFLPAKFLPFPYFLLSR